MKGRSERFVLRFFPLTFGRVNLSFVTRIIRFWMIKTYTIKTYYNDEELLKTMFNSFKITRKVKISEQTCNIRTKHDVYAPKRHVNKHKTKRLIGHGSR